MVKRTDDATVICKDGAAAAGKYLSAFVYFVLFAIAIIWLIGIWSESDSLYARERLTQLYIPWVVLLAIGALFFRGLYSSVKAIVNIGKGKALLTVNSEGIQIFDDKFRHWADIELVQLTTDFDKKYIVVQCVDPHESIHYELSSPGETAEFKDLHKLKGVLDNFTDKVKVLEF